VEPVEYSLRSSVGGFIGIKTTQCVTKIQLESKEFFIGDTVDVRCHIDNSKCKADVKNVKIRIK